MRVDKLHASLVALFLAGCASQPTQPEKPAAASAAATAAPTSNSSSDSTGQFKKVERDGKRFYCDRNPRTGSRMAKPYCLNEDQYAAWKEQNDAIKDEIRRNSNPINTSNRDPGPR